MNRRASSVQEIPQLSKSDNNLQIAFRQRLKVFYRPAELSGAVDEAAKNLKWELISRAGEARLVANNPSAFHVSLGSVTVLVDGRKYAVEAEMVSPRNSSSMKVKGLPQHIKGGAEIQWESINDYGASVKHALAIKY
ncbi:fimbria/pilus periplasmic chaperone [Pseudomonas chlororaphis]|uniref:fimbrial biogenesis chaperone n=1 Tax=Pseudomonas chlororaphis TaxID=587753 RepID=UPI0030D45A9F